MIERREQAALGEQARELLLGLDRSAFRKLGEALAALDRAPRQLVDAGDAPQDLDLAPIARDPA